MRSCAPQRPAALSARHRCRSCGAALPWHASPRHGRQVPDVAAGAQAGRLRHGLAYRPL
jgi:hypothetical protein